MSDVVTVRNINIGEGNTKIFVPIVGKTQDEIISETESIEKLLPDVVEWRVDFYEEVERMDKVLETLIYIRKNLKDVPILFTFRSIREGGNKKISDEYYIKLNCMAIESKIIDLIDIELFNKEENIKKILNTAHSNSVYVIMSNHDFKQTPSKDEIISRLLKMQNLRADILKIAFMPNSVSDVLVLLEATNYMKENHANKPLITISMGKKGVISRIVGKTFGSAATFASGEKVSAPGQIFALELRQILSVLNK